VARGAAGEPAAVADNARRRVFPSSPWAMNEGRRGQKCDGRRADDGYQMRRGRKSIEIIGTRNMASSLTFAEEEIIPLQRRQKSLQERASVARSLLLLLLRRRQSHSPRPATLPRPRPTVAAATSGVARRAGPAQTSAAAAAAANDLERTKAPKGLFLFVLSLLEVRGRVG